MKLVRYLSFKDWIIIAISIGLITFQVWLDLTLPQYMGRITMLVQTPGSTLDSVLEAGLRMILITLGSVLVSILVAALAAKLASSFPARLRSALYVKIQHFAVKEMQSFSIASLITRTTNDITQIQMLIIVGLQIIIRSPILAVWAVIKIMDKHLYWSIAASAAVFALVTASLIVMALVIPKFKVIQHQTDELNRVSREHVNGIRVVRAYNAQAHQEAKFESANNALYHSNLFTNRLMATMMPLVELIMNGLTLSIYWIGAALIASSTLEIRLNLFSDMMIFSSYALQLLIAFMMFVIVLTLTPRASVAANRIRAVLETPPSLVDSDYEPKAINAIGTIEFRNVSFKYPDAEDYVLFDINFKIKQGETVAFIGSTGCGKSTIVNLIPRFYDVTEGEILVDNVNVKAYRQSALRNHIGYVSQKAVLFKGSVFSNVAFGSHGQQILSRETVIEAVATAQSTDFVESMDNTYDSFIASGGTNLSGGQKQRLSIARAIARKPKILIFDDSFSALDYRTDANLRRELKKHVAGTTVLIVAQRIGTIKDADTIVVLEKGRIVGIGSHKDLLHTCHVYHEIAHSQLSKEELALA